MMRKLASSSSQKMLTRKKYSSLLSSSGLKSVQVPTLSLVNGISVRNVQSSREMSELQMNNRMFITKKVLDKQVEIMKNEQISDNLK